VSRKWLLCDPNPVILVLLVPESRLCQFSDYEDVDLTFINGHH